MGTGNHYWLDCLAGVAIALATGAALFQRGMLSRWRSTAAT